MAVTVFQQPATTRENKNYYIANGGSGGGSTPRPTTPRPTTPTKPKPDKAAADKAAAEKAAAEAKKKQAALTAQGLAGKPINAGFFDPAVGVLQPNQGGLDYNWSPQAAATTYNWLFGGLPGVADASSGGKPVAGTLEDFIMGKPAKGVGGTPSTGGGGGGAVTNPWQQQMINNLMYGNPNYGVRTSGGETLSGDALLQRILAAQNARAG